MQFAIERGAEQRRFEATGRPIEDEDVGSGVIVIREFTGNPDL